MKTNFANGADVLALRKSLKLNQSQFWTLIGIAQSGGSRYETGRTIPLPVRLLLEIAYGSKAVAERRVAKLRGVAA